MTDMLPGVKATLDYYKKEKDRLTAEKQKLVKENHKLRVTAKRAYDQYKKMIASHQTPDIDDYIKIANALDQINLLMSQSAMFNKNISVKVAHAAKSLQEFVELIKKYDDEKTSYELKGDFHHIRSGTYGFENKSIIPASEVDDMYDTIHDSKHGVVVGSHPVEFTPWGNQ